MRPDKEMYLKKELQERGVKFALQPVEKADMVESQKGNLQAIQKFLFVLKTEAKLKDASIKKYDKLLLIVFNNIYTPLCSVTESLLSAVVTNVCREKDYSISYTQDLISIINRFMIWAKNNMYTNLTVTVKNPDTGKVSFVRNTDNVNAQEHKQLASKAIQNKPKPVTNILEVITKPGSVSNINNAVNIDDLRNVAILSLIRNTNLIPEEIETLNIYDFLHDRIIFQAHGKRSMMRVVTLNKETRKSIYNYLINRDTTEDALFLSSERPNERIQTYEIRKISTL